MPHLWMFLLQALTPPGHETILIDGNTRPMSDAELVQFAVEQNVGLVGIGAMTRMIAKAYRVADSLRAAGIPVVMGGPHVTEIPDEALGRNGEPRHADALALGEADETWPVIVEDAARGQLKEIYTPTDASGKERKPPLKDYPAIPWESLDLKQFNRIPAVFRPIMRHFKAEWETFHIVPIESGRGCPYGCEFCTVTGFFGDSIRFRTNQSVVDEMLRLKQRGRGSRGKVAVFFVDDNFAINVKRTKSLLRDIIAAGAELSWVAQISANLLRDEELLDLIAASGGKWIFIGMESLDPANLASVKKGFNKPAEYAESCRGWRDGMSTRSRRSSSDWITILPASPNVRWRRSASGHQFCPCSDRSHRFLRLRCTTAWQKKGGSRGRNTGSNLRHFEWPTRRRTFRYRRYKTRCDMRGRTPTVRPPPNWHSSQLRMSRRPTRSAT